MARNADGVYKRKDRPGFWITWHDAQGRRRRRKTEAPNLTQAKNARAAELTKVEKAKELGFAPAGEELFREASAAFLSHQKVRLTPAGYEGERGIVEEHLNNFFPCPIRGIRRLDVQRYVTKRCGEVSAEIPINNAFGVKGPKAPAGRIRYLQLTELRAVLDACPAWLRPIAGLAVYAGMRRSEILNFDGSM